MSGIGELAALATGLCWAISVLWFRQLGSQFSPLTLNLYKGLIASTGLVVALLFIDFVMPSNHDILWLLLSGVIGIGIGDTAFFAALNRMGERSTMLLTESMAPIFTAALAMVWLAEMLSVYQWMAIAVIIFGVDLVIRCAKTKALNLGSFSMSGLSFAGLAAVCQAVGAVIGRDVLTHSQVDAVSSSLIRLLGGVALVVVILVLRQQSFKPAKALSKCDWQYLLAATAVGTLIAMVLQMFAFANAPAAIVQSLFTSSVIFTLIIARLKGQAVSRKAFLGSLIASFGVAMILLR